MARQGGQVHLEQSDMHFAFNMAKMARREFSRAAIEEMQQLIKKPHAAVQKRKKRGVVLPSHNKGHAAIERHSAIVHENQTDGCLSCQQRTAQHLQIPWRCKGTGAPPPRRVPPRQGMPCVLSDDEQSS